MLNLSFKQKLIFLSIIMGITPMLLVSLVSYNNLQEEIKLMSEKQLNSVTQNRSNLIKNYFFNLNNRAINLTSNLSTKESFKEFEKGISEFSDISEDVKNKYNKELSKNLENKFNQTYKEHNGSDFESKKYFDSLDPVALKLQYASLNNDFSSTQIYQNSLMSFDHLFEKFIKLNKISDFYFISESQNRIIYSVNKGLDLGLRLDHPNLKDSNLNKLINKLQSSQNSDDVHIIDFDNYFANYNRPSYFLGSAIFDNGRKIGYLVFRLSVQNLNYIMSDRTGFSHSMETFLVGEDHLLRSDSHLKPDQLSAWNSFKNKEKSKLETVPIKLGLKGESGVNFEKDYLQEDSIVSYSPVKVLEELNWVLITKVHISDAYSTLFSLRNSMLYLALGTMLIIFLISYFIYSNISDKLLTISENLKTRISSLTKVGSEILNSSTRLSESSTEQASSLQETVSSIDEISAMVQKNAEAAVKSTDVSNRSTQKAFDGKQTVEAMIHSINNISDSNDTMTNYIQKSNEEISKIVLMINDIGNKTKIINDIVFQTKLLSFNASVEAARAGEHGKGFAVVAEEVGNLASMSGKAALEITELLDKSNKEVTNIVNSTKSKIEELVKTGKDKVQIGIDKANECGDALEEILNNVKNVNELVNEISIASNEQSQGINEVSKALSQLDTVTQSNSTLADLSARQSEELEEDTTNLQQVLNNLMNLLGGATLKTNHQKENSKNQKEHNNVIKLNNISDRYNDKVAKDSKQEIFNEKKVVNDSVKVPSREDSRFEDF